MVEKFIISLRKKSERKLDKLIMENCPPNLSLSRTKIQDLIKRNMIFDPKKLNILTLKTKTDDLEQIIIYLDDTHQKNLLPENLDVPIVFEDDSLAVLNKPSNMVVHPVKSSQSCTLVNFLIFKNLSIKCRSIVGFDTVFLKFDIILWGGSSFSFLNKGPEHGAFFDMKMIFSQKS